MKFSSNSISGREYPDTMIDSKSQAQFVQAFWKYISKLRKPSDVRPQL